MQGTAGAGGNILGQRVFRTLPRGLMRGELRLYLRQSLRRKGRCCLGHRVGTGGGVGDHLGDMRRLGHVLPVFLGHLGLHGFDHQPRGVKDVLEIGDPQLFARVFGQRGLFLPLAEGQLAPLENRADIRRENAPIHIAEPTQKEIGSGFYRVIRRLEPRGKGPAGSIGCANLAETDEGFHLVLAAMYVLFHPAQARQVSITAIRHQLRRVLQPPEKRIKPRKPFGVAVPDDTARHADETTRHGHLPARLHRGGVAKKIGRRAGIAPQDRLGRDAGGQKLPRRITPRLRRADLGHDRAVHQNRVNCSGGGANRARRSMLSVNPPGDQPPAVTKLRAFFMDAPMRIRSS